MPDVIRRLPGILAAWINPNWTGFLQSREPLLWLLALVSGLAVSVAAILFREAIGLTQFLWLGTTVETMATSASQVPWYVVLLTPAPGALLSAGC